MSLDGGLHPACFNVLRASVSVVYGGAGAPTAFAATPAAGCASSQVEAGLTIPVQLVRHSSRATMFHPESANLRPNSSSGASSADALTRRQRDVLYLIVKGQSNKEIARALKLAEGTVKIHVAALFNKLGVTRRAAVALAGARFLGNGYSSAHTIVEQLSKPLLRAPGTSAGPIKKSRVN